MASATPNASKSTPAGELDVLIVGAGISGIDAAYHLQQHCPTKSFALLENQSNFGGTWRTHTYPGIRSDSDLFTFGFDWKPWSGPPIATAAQILNYLDEALDEQDIRRHIRYSHQVQAAKWSSDLNRWTVEVLDRDKGETRVFTAQFLWMCQGYYRHQEGYTPDFPGLDSFTGSVLHPQRWPEDFDAQGKKIVVIGSGATAATLIPAIADECEHVTMLQRSPTYFFARPNENELANTLRELEVSPDWIHEIVRRKVLFDQKVVSQRSFHDSDGLRNDLIAGARAYLGEDFDVDKHFTPAYRPWQQRIALIPDGDLFRSIRAGKASVVTEEIQRFVPSGIQLNSGTVLEADVVVTATGFNFCILGDVAIEIDGAPLDFSKCVTYRGVMYSGVPNMAWVFGYFRSSWTLRADLISNYVCRLLNHLERKGVEVATPKLRDEDHAMALGPFIDPENFNPGYVMRSLHLLPRQGDRDPWRFEHDYYAERDILPCAELDDGVLTYS
ncbi:MAG: NAD(P)/FAD-dependent oxidoreductase [Gammaproteobacteria bacterium]|nr:NAD(P)/FAD-dependent oxidoreductase [Gammaproteobacteria bacterium]